MTLTIAVLEAKPEKRLHVRQALEQMIADAATEDPELRRYELYESPDEPNRFVIQRDLDVVDQRLAERGAERLMEIGTALREELNAPIQIDRLRLVQTQAASR